MVSHFLVLLQRMLMSDFSNTTAQGRHPVTAGASPTAVRRHPFMPYQLCTHLPFHGCSSQVINPILLVSKGWRPGCQLLEEGQVVGRLEP